MDNQIFATVRGVDDPSVADRSIRLGLEIGRLILFDGIVKINRVDNLFEIGSESQLLKTIEVLSVPVHRRLLSSFVLLVIIGRIIVSVPVRPDYLESVSNLLLLLTIFALAS